MKFTDCIEIVGSKPTLYEGTKQYVSTGAVEEYFINEKSIEEYSYKERPSRADLVGKSGDILFAKMAETKKTLILNKETENYLFSTGFFAIRPKNGILTTKCLYYLLNSKNFLNQKDKNSSGATQKAITNAGLEKINVNIPLFFKQDQIVKQFDLLTDIIKKYQSQLKKLDSLIKSRFIEMFGDPVINEKNWEKVRLDSVADIKIGPFGSLLHQEDYITGGHALVNPSHIIDGRICTDEKLTISDEKYTELTPYHLQKHDVVMGRRGEMGRCAVVDSDGLLCGTGSLIIRTKGELKSDFIQKIISFPSYKKTIEDKAVGQTMPNLNVPIVSSFEIIKPPKEIQDNYYTFVQQIDKSKFENNYKELVA